MIANENRQNNYCQQFYERLILSFSEEIFLDAIKSLVNKDIGTDMIRAHSVLAETLEYQYPCLDVLHRSQRVSTLRQTVLEQINTRRKRFLLGI